MNYKIFFQAMMAMVVIAFMACNQQENSGNAEVTLNNELDSVSYGLGVSVGKNIKSQGMKEVNEAAFAKGLKEVFADTELLMNEEAIGSTLNAYFKKAHEADAQEKQKEEQEFFQKNKQEEGVVELPSGLQYKVLEEGNGEKPGLDDKVTVNYKGTFINGEVFDSSIDRGKPVSFQVNGVIPGWRQALQLMPVGAKWKLFVPSELAYGERGAGEDIPPYTPLIFEVELLSVDSAAAE